MSYPAVECSPSKAFGPTQFARVRTAVDSGIHFMIGSLFYAISIADKLPCKMKVFALVSLVTSAALAAPVDFNSEVRPILSEHCYTCHGPDVAARNSRT